MSNATKTFMLMPAFGDNITIKDGAELEHMIRRIEQGPGDESVVEVYSDAREMFEVRVVSNDQNALSLIVAACARCGKPGVRGQRTVIYPSTRENEFVVRIARSVWYDDETVTLGYPSNENEVQREREEISKRFAKLARNNGVHFDVAFLAPVNETEIAQEDADQAYLWAMNLLWKARKAMFDVEFLIQEAAERGDAKQIRQDADRIFRIFDDIKNAEEAAQIPVPESAAHEEPEPRRNQVFRQSFEVDADKVIWG